MDLHTLQEVSDGSARRRVVAVAVFVTALGFCACSPLSERYSSRLRPLNVITYVTTDNRVIQKKAHFEDKHSNVITLVDDARDGLLPYGDEDGLVDRVSVEIYKRGALDGLFDFIINHGVIYTDHLAELREKNLKGINREAARLLTDKFMGQNNYMKTASFKTEYKVALKSMDAKTSEAVIEVDGQEGRIKKDVVRKINDVYVSLDKITRFTAGPDSDEEIDSGFAVILIGNQGILLKEGQQTRISIDPGSASRRKLLKKEKVNFVFVVGDTVPDKAQCELEDIFHTFLVDRPDHQHISMYRMVREMGGVVSADSHAVTGYQIVEDPYAEPKEGNFVTDVKDRIKDGFNAGIKDIYEFLAGVGSQTAQALNFGGGALGRSFSSGR